MTEHNQYSDERLQAFVDDEVDLAERAEIMNAVQQDNALACRVCELLQIKDSVRLAYREPERPQHSQPVLPERWYRRIPTQAAAALVVFTLGTGTGLLLHGQGGAPWTQHGRLVAANGAQQLEQKRIVFHISTANPDRLREALDDAEELLASYKGHPELVQLDVVANAAGLSLLRTDTSAFPERIRKLAGEYHNIRFLACSRSMEKLTLKGVDVHLLPEAEVIPAALEAIVDRLQEGWMYIRV